MDDGLVFFYSALVASELCRTVANLYIVGDKTDIRVDVGSAAINKEVCYELHEEHRHAVVGDLAHPLGTGAVGHFELRGHAHHHWNPVDCGSGVYPDRPLAGAR